jgi:dephospho-CoA kinase
MHPAIRRLTDQRAEAAQGPYCMVAIPLLVETGGKDRFQRVLVVDCEPELQVARLMARDGMTREAATRMLAAQAPRAARLSVADDVIRNDGDIANLRDQVAKLHREYLAAAHVVSRTQSAGGAT